jgi:hypothetical protein
MAELVLIVAKGTSTFDPAAEKTRFGGGWLEGLDVDALQNSVGKTLFYSEGEKG